MVKFSFTVPKDLVLVALVRGGYSGAVTTAL